MSEEQYQAAALRDAYKEKFGELPECGREIRRDNYDNDRERLLRALTWLNRGAQTQSDDEKLLFNYIALNALFGRPEDDTASLKQIRDNKENFMRALVKHDRDRALLLFACEEEATIKQLVDNPYLWGPFWQPEQESGINWQTARQAQLDTTLKGLGIIKKWYPKVQKNRHEKMPLKVRNVAGDVLFCAISRARVLRNQIVHGSCCYGDGYNRTQMHTCAKFLPPLVGRMIKIMISAARHDVWFDIATPPQGAPDEETQTAKPLTDTKN